MNKAEGTLTLGACLSVESGFFHRETTFSFFVLVICALHRKVDMCSSTSKVELIVDTPLATNG